MEDTDIVSNARVQRAMALFPVQDFTFERDMRPHMSACSFAIIGSSKSGKTTFLKYLLKKHFTDDIKVLYTQSLHNDIYTSLKKDMCQAPGWMPDVIKACYKINKATKNNYPFLHIVDDLIGAKADKEMTKLLCLYRNSNMSAIVSGQDFTLLSPTGRANTNHICLFYQNTDSRCEDNIKAFVRSYFPRTLTLEEKIALYKALTADHHFLHIDNLNNTIRRCRLKPSQMVE
jgi:GTPase SAR1 family protein